MDIADRVASVAVSMHPYVGTPLLYGAAAFAGSAALSRAVLEEQENKRAAFAVLGASFFVCTIENLSVAKMHILNVTDFQVKCGIANSVLQVLFVLCFLTDITALLRRALSIQQLWANISVAAIAATVGAIIPVIAVYLSKDLDEVVSSITASATVAILVGWARLHGKIAMLLMASFGVAYIVPQTGYYDESPLMHDLMRVGALGIGLVLSIPLFSRSGAGPESNVVSTSPKVALS